MDRLDLAVVGGGNGSYTMAADFALAGHRVRMWPGAREKHAALHGEKKIRLEGLGRTGEARLALVSEDVGAVVRGAGIILCTDPAPSQAARAAILAPHLEDGQVLFLSPGSLGPIVFERALRGRGGAARVCYAEPGTLPYLTRKVAPTRVQVSGLAKHLPVGVFPASRTAEAMRKVARLFPAAHPVENSLSAALLNVGPIIHPVLFLLNTGAIEHFQAWDIHNEGTTPSVKRLILSHDAERLELRRALGFAPPHYPFRDHYEPAGEAEWMYGRKAHTQLVESEKWRESLDFRHRYVVEDVKCNLALMASIGKWCGAATPIADSLLTLIGAVAGEDFRRSGRTLEALGLAGYSAGALNDLLGRGFDPETPAAPGRPGKA
jgi:opine dehydrogenase